MALTLNLKPISPNERIQILDILRGFAIFGILAVNISGFATTTFFPGHNQTNLFWYNKLAFEVMSFLTEGKFYTMFSFLFGLGFAVQLERAEKSGRDFKSFYPRRLLILFGFGVLHAILLWYGDILRLYSLLGFALLAFRHQSNRIVLIWSGVFFICAFSLLVLIGGPADNEPIPGMDFISMARQAYHGSSFLDAVAFHTAIFPAAFIAIALTQGLSVMALFLLGLLIGRTHFFERLAENRIWLLRALIVGLIVGVPANILFLVSDNPIISSLGFTLGSPAFAAVYVSLVGLFSLTEFGQVMLLPLAFVGRMALTNYILQSVLCSLLFSGYGFGF